MVVTLFVLFGWAVLALAAGILFGRATRLPHGAPRGHRPLSSKRFHLN